ncbi:helix-turn-helix transcriptional regulator [Trichloromonas sp.]|uniref:helix-turn-helix transcriptional regulator n=1 Tax=Trichloromonas sp. TaxID=3069249 RepID=UPI002A3F7285|nr:helix-turn-helix domain-containing protein [Trichloromonas sp.]
MEKLLTLNEVAEILRVAPSTLRNARFRKEENRWPRSFKVGGSLRWDAEEVRAWVEAQKPTGAPQAQAALPVNRRRVGRPTRAERAQQSARRKT